MPNEIRKCMLRYASKQTLMGDSTERTEEVKGTWDFLKKELKFKENIGDETQTVEVETTFVFKDEAVEVYRDGELSFNFRKDKDTQTTYNTPYGAMAMVIKTSQLAYSIDEKNGTAYLEYNIFFDPEVKSDCTYGLKFECHD